jgi:hypothetical protein
MRHFPLKNFVFIFSAVVGLSLLWACERHHEGDEEQLTETVNLFTTAYFNWHFQEALKNVDDDSRRWLVYAATNVHQADIDSLRAMKMGASHEIDDVDYTSDTTAVAFVTVSNFLAMDTIGTSGHVVEKAKFALPLTYEKGKWQVSLRELPRQMKEHN